MNLHGDSSLAGQLTAVRVPARAEAATYPKDGDAADYGSILSRRERVVGRPKISLRRAGAWRRLLDVNYPLLRHFGL